MDRKALTLPLEAKDVSDDGEFEGYLAVWGEVDAEGDIVEEGAFTRTLEEKGRRRPLLWQHDPGEPVGTLDAEQDDHGLLINGKLNLDVQRAEEAYSLLDQGAIDGLSQGFQTYDFEPRDDGDGRRLQEIDLWEGSLVTFPAQHDARVVEVNQRASGMPGLAHRLQSLLQHPALHREAPTPGLEGFVAREHVKEFRTVVAFKDHALASEDHPWDAAEAREALREWAGGDCTRFREGFVWYDGETPEDLTSYKLPIAIPVDGSLRAVPAGVEAAAAAVQGARGEVDIPDEDLAGVRDHLESYYEKMEQVAPWNQDGNGRQVDADALTELRDSLKQVPAPDA